MNKKPAPVSALDDDLCKMIVSQFKRLATANKTAAMTAATQIGRQMRGLIHFVNVQKAVVDQQQNTIEELMIFKRRIEALENERNGTDAVSDLGDQLDDSGNPDDSELVSGSLDPETETTG